MKRRSALGTSRQTTRLKAVGTSTVLLLPLILAAAYLNMGPTCCSGNCPPPTPESFVVTNHTNGTPADNDSWRSATSSDGSQIAFASQADNLGAPSDGALVDVFVHDINTKETTWVGLASSTFTLAPALDLTGDYAVFTVADPAYPGFQVGGLDTSGTDQTIDWIFTQNGLFDPQPSISGNGRYVAFRTDWKGTSLGDWDELHDIYVRDRQTGDLLLIGEEFATQYGLHAHSPKLASRFERIVYQLGDEWVRSVNVNFSSPSFPTTFPGIRPSIDAWGAKIAYRHVWPGQEGAIYVHEQGLHQIVSIDAWGQNVTQGCDYPVISGDGRFVAFQCADPMTSHGGYNQVYVRDLVAETTKLASISPDGVPADQGAIATALSYDGSSVTLESTSTNLGTIAAGTKQVFRVPASYWDGGCNPISSDDTTCDGVDDDCDGQSDEDYVSQASSCGLGPCAATGELVCSGGVVTDTCQAGTPAADDATCNGVDDDCNGLQDDGFPVAVTSCGSGQCTSSGVVRCEAGIVVDSCVADVNCLDDTDLDQIPDTEDPCPLFYDRMMVPGFDCQRAAPAIGVQQVPTVTSQPTVTITGGAPATGFLIVLGGIAPKVARINAGSAYNVEVYLRPDMNNRLVVFGQYDDGRRTFVTLVNVTHQSEPGQDTLTGTVTNPQGVPIAGAVVRGGGAASVTDATGQFELTDIPSDRNIVLELFADGYLREVEFSGVPSDPIDLTMDPETTTEVLVGPTGGTLQTDGFELVVPPGALAVGQEVRLSARSPKGSHVSEGLGIGGIDITPDQDFLTPVTLRIPNEYGTPPGRAQLVSGYDPGGHPGLFDFAVASPDGQFLEVQLRSARGLAFPRPPLWIFVRDFVDLGSSPRYFSTGDFIGGSTGHLEVRAGPTLCTKKTWTLSVALDLTATQVPCKTALDSIWVWPCTIYHREWEFIVHTTEAGLYGGWYDWEYYPLTDTWEAKEVLEVPLATVTTETPTQVGLRQVPNRPDEPVPGCTPDP